MTTIGKKLGKDFSPAGKLGAGIHNVFILRVKKMLDRYDSAVCVSEGRPQREILHMILKTDKDGGKDEYCQVFEIPINWTMGTETEDPRVKSRVHGDRIISMLEIMGEYNEGIQFDENLVSKFNGKTFQWVVEKTPGNAARVNNIAKSDSEGPLFKHEEAPEQSEENGECPF